MNRFWMALATILALAGLVLAAPAMAQQRVTATAAGISIEMPQGWSVVPVSEVMQRLLALDQDNEEFRRVIRSGKADPVITITRYPVSGIGISPSVKIHYGYYPEARHTRLSDMVAGSVDQVRIGFGEVEVLTGPADTVFSGLPAAHVRIRFRIRDNGTEYTVVSDLWIARRGDYLLMIGTNYDQNESPETLAQLRAAVASIEIKSETRRAQGD